jgi:hypothetical protein
MPRSAAEEIERLYTLPLEEFTSARDRVARELRKEGEGADADRVKRLRKPTVAAWVVNQLARQEKMNVRALLSAGERLREAHQDVLQGKSPAKVHKAQADERRVIDALAKSAEKLLSEQRQRASDSVLDDVRETLHAAVVDADLAEQVRGGRLAREAQASGFGFEMGPAQGKVPARSKRGQTDRERERRRKASEKLEQAKARVREAREELRVSEKEAERARTESERAERRVDAHKKALQQAEQTLKKAGG